MTFRRVELSSILRFKERSVERRGREGAILMIDGERQNGVGSSVRDTVAGFFRGYK